MRFLAIETSCDETSASVVEKSNNSITVLSNTTSSSARIHAATGGIIPEQAAREQIRAIIPVINEAVLSSEKVTPASNTDEFDKVNKIIREKIDGFAVTVGPGLIGSLLVGVETVKTLALSYNKPIIPTNHLLGHLYANFIRDEHPKRIPFPFVGLIISGGHTDLLYFRSHNEYKWLGGTRDDAAGEALDKIGRMIGIPYPAGQEIERRASFSKDSTLRFQSPLLHEDTYDFSFSGLKTEVMRYVKANELTDQTINDICRATQDAVIKVVVNKTIKALKQFENSTLLIGGGVAANSKLRSGFVEKAKDLKINLNLYAPRPEFCADNAAMIGTRALLVNVPSPWKDIKAQPELYF